MKKVYVQGPKGLVHLDRTEGNRDVTFLFETGEELKVSDGSHTFEDLYEHRHALFVALCKAAQSTVEHADENSYPSIVVRRVWRSHLHADGSMFPGYFIMGIGKEPGSQITYHLPIKYWTETDFAETLEQAPAWDGHTPEDVLERLKRL